MRTILGAWRGELRAVAGDPAALLILGLAVIAYGVVYPLPYARQRVREVAVVVVDPDGTETSRRLTRMIDRTEELRVARVVRAMGDAEPVVRAGDAGGVVAIPHGFERDLRRGRRVVVGAFGNAGYFMLYSPVAAGVARAAGTLSAGVEIRRLEAAGSTERAARRLRDPIPLTLRPLYNPGGGYGTAVVPAVLIVLLQQTLLVGIGTVGGGRRERGHPVHARDALALLGRGLAYASLYLGHVLFSFTVVYRLYGMPHQGSLVALLAFLAPFLLASAFLGLAMAGLFPDRESALPVLVATSIPAIFLSGFSWPAEAIPGWLRVPAALLPSTSAVSGGVRVFQLGASLADVRGPWLTLWALAAAYFLAALATARTTTRTTAPAPARAGASR